MDTPSLALLSGQAALRRQVDVVANNLANVSTTGFRREAVLFGTVYERTEASDRLALAHDRVSLTDFSQGGLRSTGNELDVAIEGDAFLRLAADGPPRFTRDGRLTVNALGELASLTGEAVTDESGAPLRVPEGSGSLSISTDGTISVANGDIVGTIGLFRVEEGDRRRLPGGQFEAAGFEVADDSRLLQGHLEDSNADPVLTLTELIEVQRAYERGQSLLSAEDERARRAIERLGPKA